MLQFDSAQIQSRARREALHAEAEHDRVLRLLRTPAPRERRLRGRLAASLYTLALRPDPPLVEGLGVRPGSLAAPR